MYTVTFNPDEFKKAVRNVASVVSINAVLPILEDILFKVTADGKCQLIGTDLQNTLAMTINCQATEDFEFLMVAENIVSFCKNAPNIPLEMTINPDTNMITIKVQGTKTEMSYPLPGDINMFPNLPAIRSKMCLMPTEAVAHLLTAGKFTSKDELRPAMTGVLIEAKKGTIDIAATDAHSMYHSGEMEMSWAEEIEDDSFVIPKSAVLLIGALLTASNIKIGMAKGADADTASTVCFCSDDICVFTKLIDAKFPPYKTVIPLRGRFLIVPSNDLISAIKLCSTTANKTTAQVTFKVYGDRLEISAQDIDFSTSSKTELLISNPQDIDLVFAMNGKLLLERNLAVLSGDIEIYVESPTRAALFVEAGSKTTTLCMPLMVGV